eukprot:scaffold252776_cov30-Prasinocladus_malaysianus.AAC.2
MTAPPWPTWSPSHAAAVPAHAGAACHPRRPPGRPSRDILQPATAWSTCQPLPPPMPTTAWQHAAPPPPHAPAAFQPSAPLEGRFLGIWRQPGPQTGPPPSWRLLCCRSG